MSGPTTVIVATDPVIVLLVAATIRAAQGLHAVYGEAASQRQQYQADRKASQQRQDHANRQRQQALDSAAADAQTRFDHLLTIAQSLGVEQQVEASRPAPPANQNEDEQAADERAAYVRVMQALNDELETALLYETARRMDDADLSTLAIPNAQAGATVPVPAGDPQTIAQRLLARIVHLGPIPQEITNVALELARTLPGERADLLASDLRLRIQKHLDAIGQRLAQEATAVIIEQTLKDLGYQVEEIADTLFVEGGVAHFRRQSWGDYMVRMRINAKGSEANFNVIRAVTANNNEKSVLDHIAEDRWCTEFPALMQMLAVRGVHLNVTRRLEAGELPVQLVDSSKLPQFTDGSEADQQQTKQAELTRSTK